ncbi:MULTISPECIES: PspC domain-containing protein [Thermomonosporaceae]|uniref:PspC domain-containing protein n=1 Tax=Thermomonosporaceae TaxID=2012 RepID=UPI00255AE2CC|nr:MULTISPECIES: PspC domain-containing protein [Thermomonosporaceae]MDL4776190.1 PspC domain-containing protein [Actinomadura xylanilytica]
MTEEQGATAATAPPGDDYRRLARDPERRVLAGVCTGFGRFTGIDPVVFRVGFAILVLAHGQGVLLYLAAALLMPGRPGEAAFAERLLKRWFDASAVLSIMAALVCLGVAGSLFGGLSTDAIAVMTVFGLMLVVAHARGVDLVGAVRSMPERLHGHPPAPTSLEDDRAFAGTGVRLEKNAPSGARGGLPEGMIDLADLGSRSSPAPGGTGDASAPGRWPVPPMSAPPAHGRGRTPRAKSPLTSVTVLAAIVAGAAMLPVAHGRPVLDAVLVVGAPALAVGGLGLLLGGWFRVRGLATVTTLLTLTLLTTAAATAVPRDLGYGDMDWRPTDADRTYQEYKHGIGSVWLDLTALPVPRGKRVTINAKLIAGSMVVSLPATARVTLDAQTGLGDLSVGPRTISGPNARSTNVLEPEGGTVSNPPEIVLRIRARLGDVRVTRD